MILNLKKENDVATKQITIERFNVVSRELSWANESHRTDK